MTKGSPLPPFDYHCLLLSLPWAFKTDISTIPGTHPYLQCDSRKRDQWSDILGPKTKTRVGIVWSGSSDHAIDYNRSIALSMLLPFLPDAFEYFSLQKEVRDADQATLAAHSHIRHIGEQLQDFSDTAALCDLMDVVISVDTSVAHLSAALGKPTWILLP
ncbi:MAG: glycosyltransferase family 9 protein, partial [Rhodanobacter sp.]